MPTKLYDTPTDIEYGKILAVLFVGGVSTYILYNRDASKNKKRNPVLYSIFCFVVSLFLYLFILNFSSDFFSSQKKLLRTTLGESTGIDTREMRTGEPQF
jgi:uncharacterized membrane-anchored protein